jgi:hypothetical protein
MHLLIPGLSKCVIIYYSAAKVDIVSKQVIKPGYDSFEEEVEIEQPSIELINKFRNSKDSFYWLKKDEVPFEVETDKIIQLDVFSELDKNILLLCLQNENDKRKDLVFCYFNENFGNFKISKSDKPLSADNKSIIGMLLYNSINTYLQVLNRDLNEFVYVNKVTQTIIKNLKDSEKRIETLLESKQQNILAYCKDYLNESIIRGKKFKFSDSALEKLKDYDGQISQLKKIVKKAAVYVSSVNYGIAESNLVIEDYHLNFDEPLKKQADEVIVNYEAGDRYSKTMRLLDKLEEAANKIIAENKMLTSANVGLACENPITAPAITDALKKHKSKILTLIKNHPDKWSTIKKEFRPLMNILTIKPDSYQSNELQTG